MKERHKEGEYAMEIRGEESDGRRENGDGERQYLNDLCTITDRFRDSLTNSKVHATTPLLGQAKWTHSCSPLNLLMMAGETSW